MMSRKIRLGEANRLGGLSEANRFGHRAITALGGVVLVLAFSTPRADAASKEVAAKVREANKAYAAGHYEEALEQYTLAEVDCPACPQIAYNQALTLYRMRDFEKARELFNEALTTRNLDLEAKAKFNLGNVAYSQALEKLSSLKEAIELAQQAIYHYRDALEIDPQDNDARANIEIAQLLIKDLLDKQKQEQEKQQQDQQNSCQNPQEQNSDQQNPDQQKQDGQSGDQQQDQQKQQQQDQQQGQEQDQDQEQEQQAASTEQAPPEDEEQAAAQAVEERELSGEEVDRMLQAVRDKEARRREELARRMRARRVPVSRDW